MLHSTTATPGRPGVVSVALAVAALFAALALAFAPAVAQADYPAGVKKGFMKTCVPAAKSSSEGRFNRSQARTYCSVAFDCLEKRLTLSEFAKLDNAKGRIKRIRDTCTEKGARAALS